MHMADALVAPAVAATMYAASTVVTGYSIKKVSLEQDNKKAPLMGVMGAFVFAAQMINFTVPGTGSSGHIVGGLLLAALLGPYAGFITMVGILLVQALLFADGGLLALGCNIWNMAFYFCFFGYFCIYRPIMKNGFSRGKIILASIIGCILSLQLGAFSVVIQTLASGITELPFSVFLIAMQPIHIAIGLIEGLVTAAVLIFIYETRPELLKATNKENKISFKKIIIILSIVVVVIGGILSLFASSNPDGLEWSIGKVTGGSEVEAVGDVYDSANQIQGITSLLPDYSFGTDSEGVLGTSVSGIVGAGTVLVICVAGFYFIKYLRKRKSFRKIKEAKDE